jgi:hypothetical protein
MSDEVRVVKSAYMCPVCHKAHLRTAWRGGRQIAHHCTSDGCSSWFKAIENFELKSDGLYLMEQAELIPKGQIFELGGKPVPGL